MINNMGIINLDPKRGTVKKKSNTVLIKFICSIYKLKMKKIETGLFLKYKLIMKI